MSLFRRSRPASEGERSHAWVIVGLGNPGEDYASTRHNAGAMVLDALAQRMRARLKRHRTSCLVAEESQGGRRVVLARPLSYMNESGRPVAELVRFYKLPVERLIVVHDEIDIPFGEVRVKSGGGTAGHNGLGSIVGHLGSRDFVRVRVGVSRPPGRREAAGHVLSRFSSAERKQLPDLIERSADAVERILEIGVERAMNEINTRGRE